MDRLPRRRRRHWVGVDAVHAILGAVILLGSSRCWVIAPAQSAVPAQRARPLPQPVSPMGTSPSSHIHAIRQERTHIHGDRDHIVGPREQRHEVDQEKFGQPAGQIHARGRQACRQQQTVQGDPFTGGGDPLDRAVRQHPGRVEQLSVANGPRRSEPAGRRYRDLHPPGAPGPMSRQTTWAV